MLQTLAHSRLLLIREFWKPRQTIEGMQRNDNAYLEAVDELGQRNILLVPEDVDRLEVLGRSILELEPEEVADIRCTRATELNRQSRSEVGCVVFMSVRPKEAQVGYSRIAASSG